LSKRPTKLYLSGPMSGLPDDNFPAFNEAADKLRKVGYEVVNPAEYGRSGGWQWQDYILRDLPVLCTCDGVATLTGWGASDGAAVEVAFAVGLDIPEYAAETWLLNAEWFTTEHEPRVYQDKTKPPVSEFRSSLLREADEVSGQSGRSRDYGHPWINHKRIADFWTVQLGPKLKDGCVIDPREVALMMVSLKLAREINTPKRDNLVDGVGYFNCADMIDHYEGQEEIGK